MPLVFKPCTCWYSGISNSLGNCWVLTSMVNLLGWNLSTGPNYIQARPGRAPGLCFSCLASGTRRPGCRLFSGCGFEDNSAERLCAMTRIDHQRAQSHHSCPSLPYLRPAASNDYLCPSEVTHGYSHHSSLPLFVLSSPKGPGLCGTDLPPIPNMTQQADLRWASLECRAHLGS